MCLSDEKAKSWTVLNTLSSWGAERFHCCPFFYVNNNVWQQYSVSNTHTTSCLPHNLLKQHSWPSEKAARHLLKISHRHREVFKAKEEKIFDLVCRFPLTPRLKAEQICQKAVWILVLPAFSQCTESFVWGVNFRIFIEYICDFYKHSCEHYANLSEHLWITKWHACDNTC